MSLEKDLKDFHEITLTEKARKLPVGFTEGHFYHYFTLVDLHLAWLAPCIV
jgi:hypothetical protein